MARDDGGMMGRDVFSLGEVYPLRAVTAVAVFAGLALSATRWWTASALVLMAAFMLQRRFDLFRASERDACMAARAAGRCPITTRC